MAPGGSSLWKSILEMLKDHLAAADEEEAQSGDAEEAQIGRQVDIAWLGQLFCMSKRASTWPSSEPRMALQAPDELLLELTVPLASCASSCWLRALHVSRPALAVEAMQAGSPRLRPSSSFLAGAIGRE